MKASHQQRFFPYAVLFVLLGLLIEFSSDISGEIKVWQVLEGENRYKLGMMFARLIGSTFESILTYGLLCAALLGSYRRYFLGLSRLWRLILDCVMLSAIIRILIYVLVMLLLFQLQTQSGYGYIYEGKTIFSLPIFMEIAGWSTLKVFIHTGIMVAIVSRWGDWNVKKGIAPTFE